MIPTAEQLGETVIARLLSENLEQEKQALEKVEAVSAQLTKQLAAA